VVSNVGAVALSRSGNPMLGEFGDATVTRKLGNAPSDLYASSRVYALRTDRSFGARRYRDKQFEARSI
jgi:hypothetical protein